MIIALSLAAALSAEAPAASDPEVRREVRIVTADGGGPGMTWTGAFPRLDKDGDGFVSRDEYVGPTTEAFRVLDKDNDGRISRDEMTEGRSLARTILGGGGGNGAPLVLGGRAGGPRAMFLGGPDGPGEREVTIIGRGEGGPDGGPMRFTLRRPGGPGGAMILGGEGVPGGPADLDKDKDGKVSEEEFLAPLRDAFRRMDKDASGALEAGEHGPGSNVHVFTRRIERPSED
ncbi:hypothetical protein ACO2Q1_12200 [Brevundimonas sp. VNH65]|uniref:EF-hand domain-containing protein n=1 Tax=Brevundimonas sp. VNH65 TaxID=3400917 RepID=UPI003C07B6D1